MIPKKILILLTLGFFFTGFAFSQGEIFYQDTPVEETSICAYSSALMYESPGRNAPKIGTVLFTEELEHLGQEAFVRGENRNYVWVRSRGGIIGWINDSYLVRNSGVVVVLDNLPVYDRPGTASARTSQRFMAGDLAILSDFRDGWVHLFGEQKYIQGWIQGYDNVSVEQEDIEVASLMTEAMRITDPVQRRKQLNQIGSSTRALSPEMTRALQKAIDATYPSNTLTQNEPDTETWQGGEDIFVDDNVNPSPGKTEIVDIYSPGIHKKEVIDMQTGRSYQRVYETGTIQPVKSKKAKDIYYAYHKTLPIGSNVLLKIPNYEGWIQLEIIARLRADNPHVVGLGPEVIQKVFGETQAKNIEKATISYPEGGSF
ncbi:MAG: SH3 domain-containing protein [Bacteroidetes bacterium]|nr:SH3 domain-containing protein [Bacteroidota bacterium]